MGGRTGVGVWRGRYAGIGGARLDVLVAATTQINDALDVGVRPADAARIAHTVAAALRFDVRLLRTVGIVARVVCCFLLGEPLLLSKFCAPVLKPDLKSAKNIGYKWYHG